MTFTITDVTNKITFLTVENDIHLPPVTVVDPTGQVMPYTLKGIPMYTPIRLTIDGKSIIVKGRDLRQALQILIP